MNNRKSPIASTTAHYVVIARPAFEDLMRRRAGTERLAQELRRQLGEEHEMLLLALHELARERGLPDRAHFVRQWLAEWRRQEPSIPVAPQQQGGGRSTAD